MKYSLDFELIRTKLLSFLKISKYQRTHNTPQSKKQYRIINFDLKLGLVLINNTV